MASHGRFRSDLCHYDSSTGSHRGLRGGKQAAHGNPAASPCGGVGSGGGVWGGAPPAFSRSAAGATVYT